MTAPRVAGRARYDALRELDAVVAEKVMAWRPISVPVGDGRELRMFVSPDLAYKTWNASHPPYYTSDMRAAWEVVANIRVRGWLLKLEQALLDHDVAEDWIATFEHTETCEEKCSLNGLFEKHDAPLAICLAALRVVGWEGSDA